MDTNEKHFNEFQIALRGFTRNRLAVGCACVLLVLYAGALLAGFFAPYSFQNEDRNYSYAPPTPVKFFDGGRFIGPYVPGMRLTFNEYNARIYRINAEEKYPVRFFVPGDEYRLLGIFPCRYHLFSVEAPGRIYLIGADARGRDVFSRLLYGAQISLSLCLIGVFISFTIGLLVGGISGYYGGRLDNFLMRLCEMVTMVPEFYLLLALRAAVPDNFSSTQVYLALVIILSFLGWPGSARIIRGMCLSLREREYVLAAKSLGLSDLRIILRHILPHTLSYSIFAVALRIPGYILAESGLSLIGLGIQDPYASWGNMLSDAMSIVRIKFAPWILWPAFFIFLTVVCFNVIGDALRDCLDPMLRGEGESK